MGAHSGYLVLTLTLLEMAFASSVCTTMTSVGFLVAGALGLAVFARYIPARLHRNKPFSRSLTLEMRERSS